MDHQGFLQRSWQRTWNETSWILAQFFYQDLRKNGLFILTNGRHTGEPHSGVTLLSLARGNWGDVDGRFVHNETVPLDPIQYQQKLFGSRFQLARTKPMADQLKNRFAIPAVFSVWGTIHGAWCWYWVLWHYWNKLRRNDYCLYARS